jgi:hypothetical protein
LARFSSSVSFAMMSALHPDTVKLIYEGIASLVVALVVAGILFRFFFEGWKDYLRCYYPRKLFSIFYSHRPDGYDRARGFIYNAIWIVAGVVAFYFIHKILG